MQDKVRVHGPGTEPWEAYVVKVDATTMYQDRDGECRLPTAVPGVPPPAGQLGSSCC